MENRHLACDGKRASSPFSASGRSLKLNAEAQSTQRKTRRRKKCRIGFQPVMENGLPACFLAAVQFLNFAGSSVAGHRG
jgi:hypothetical protein